MRNVPGDQQDTKIQLSFDVCYIIESVWGLVVLLHYSRLLESSFLPRSIKNGHAYQLSFLVNVKMHGCIFLHTAERWKNGNAMQLNNHENKMEHKLFIDRYCMFDVTWDNVANMHTWKQYKLWPYYCVDHTPRCRSTTAAWTHHCNGDVLTLTEHQIYHQTIDRYDKE